MKEFFKALDKGFPFYPKWYPALCALGYYHGQHHTSKILQVQYTKQLPLSLLCR